MRVAFCNVLRHLLDDDIYLNEIRREWNNNGIDEKIEH